LIQFLFSLALVELTRPSPQKILYFYSLYQTLFEYLKETIHNIEFIKGPNIDEISNFLLILDDLGQDCIDIKDIVLLFTVGSHHRNISILIDFLDL
jgi:hypothetical protein